MDLICDVPIRVGLVDDDPLFLEQASNLIDLRLDMAATRLQNAAELERAVRAGSLDCVVIDYNLGGDNGLNLHLALTKEHANVPPVILISGAGCETTVVKAFRSGFADYVSKRHFSIEELCGSIRRVVDKARANALAASQNPAGSQGQDVDDLTGLFRRAFMDNRLRELLADRRRRQFAVMGIRIAQFEEIRAEIGHMRAERVAHEFACTLKRVARSTDLVGHWDGKDFMVLLDAMPTPDSIALAVQRLENALSFSSRFDGIVVEARPEIRVLTYPGEVATREALLEGVFPERRIEEDERSLKTDGRDGEDGDGASWRVGAAGRRPLPVVRSTDERRRERRRRIMKRGQIIHGTHQLTIMCNVRDQSESGARLRLDSWVAVPSTLELRLVGSDFRKPAVLRWQRGLEIGIEFVETL